MKALAFGILGSACVIANTWFEVSHIHPLDSLLYAIVGGACFMAIFWQED